MATGDGWDAEEARRCAAAACRVVGVGAERLRPTRVARNAVFEVAGRDLMVRVSRPGRDRGATRVALAAHAAGLPVLVPVLTESPLEIDGRDVSFWPRCAPAGPAVDFSWLGRTLRRLHELAPALRPLVAHAPGLVPDALSSVRARLAGLEAAAADGGDDGPGRAAAARKARLCGVIGDRFAALEGALARAAPGEEVVVHGDAHPGNVLLLGDGTPVLADLDHVALAPAGWDQVPVDVETRRFGRPVPDLAALRAGYGRDCRTDDGYELLVALRELKVCTWLVGAPAEVGRRELWRRLASWADGTPATWNYV